MSANKAFFDAQLRHATGVSRYSVGEAKRVVAMLDKADADITKMLKDRLEQGMDFTSKRYKAIQQDIRAMRAEAWKVASGSHQDQLMSLAGAEASWAAKAIEKVIPIEFNFASVSADTLHTLVTQTPFAGGTNAARTLEQWWGGLQAVDAQRIQESIQSGMILGETVEQMMGRVRQVQDLTRANAAAVVRTGVSHVANGARESFFAENADVIEALRWTSTLDGRTTPICQSRDGKLAPVGDRPVPEPRLDPPAARPPAHVSCRSLMVGVLDANNIADMMPDRPFVRDTRLPAEREKDFRIAAKEKAGEAWKGMSAEQRAAAVKAEKRAWTAENVGTVPGATTYDEWLRGQPASFQDDVLGVPRADMFRAGEKLDAFVAIDGRELTLAQLHPDFPLVAEGRLRWTANRQMNWEESVSVEQSIAIHDWTWKWDQDIRRVQLGQAPLGKRSVSSVKQRIKDINEALDNGPVFSRKIYRGMALTPEDFDKILDRSGITNRTFASASQDKDTAVMFMEKNVRKLNKKLKRDDVVGALFEITSNKTGVAIDAFSELPFEQEVLLRDGASYRITSKKMQRVLVEETMAGKKTYRDIWRIQLEEIDDLPLVAEKPLADFDKLSIAEQQKYHTALQAEQ